MIDSERVISIYNRIILGKPPFEDENDEERLFREKVEREMSEFEAQEAKKGKQVIWHVPWETPE